MGSKIGNTLRIAAVATAIAPGAPAASAETTPSREAVNQTLQRDYNNLVRSAENFGVKRAVRPNDIGTVAITNNRVSFSGGNSTGTVTEIQSDVYDKNTRTLQEYVIDVYKPDSQTGNSTTMPNNLFQITLFKGKNYRADAPKTPAGFNRAINHAAGKSALGEYNFNLGVQKDGSWQVTASHSNDSQAQEFSTEPVSPMSPPETSATGNLEEVVEMVGQAEHVLSAAERNHVLPRGTPVNLRPMHSQ